ncbi:hypothetical protein HZH68_002414 [Vespula germanica]|uniref:Uncharacterized protein n=2 Tax=Vespula TaxID=7451 RepID=A0A834U012_VESGE|nr:hypothetical protein HZH66_002161 [Vespula vulgaris]KAF7413925.1 hypothetical protein HZH68_002414 [Vespula germanica]
MGAVASAGQDGRSRRGTTIVERPAAPATSHHDYYHHYDTVTTTIIAIIDESGQPPSSSMIPAMVLRMPDSYLLAWSRDYARDSVTSAAESRYRLPRQELNAMRGATG